MKICEFTQGQLQARLDERSASRGVGLVVCRTPVEQALLILSAALETVNQAGLDGKKLSDLRIVTLTDNSKHDDDQVIEIHAKVTHRLKQL